MVAMLAAGAWIAAVLLVVCVCREAQVGDGNGPERRDSAGGAATPDCSFSETLACARAEQTPLM